MRNAALILGVIAGVIGMIVGFFNFGYTTAVEHFGEIEGVAEQVQNVEMIRLTSVLAPLLALVGGAMAPSRALIGGVLMLGSAGLMFMGLGFDVFTMFPIVFAATGGLLGLAAGKPDQPKAHF